MQRPVLRLLRRESYSERLTGSIALGVSIVSGSTFIAFAKSLGTALSPLSLLFVSEALTALFILFSFGFVTIFRRITRLSKHDYAWLTVMAIFSGILGPTLLFTGLSYTSAVNAGLFTKMQILFLLILAHFILKERISRAHVAAMTVVFLGILFICLRGGTSGLDLQWGDLLVIGSTLSYGAASIVFRAKLHRLDSHIALFFRSSIAVITFFAISPFLVHPFITEIRMMPLSVLPSLLGFTLISRYLNSVTYYEALDRLPVSSVSLFGSLEIIGTTLFSYLYLGESILWYHYAGGALIIVGSILLELVGTHPSEKQLESHLKQITP